MTVKITVSREFEIEIDNPKLRELNDLCDGEWKRIPDELVNKAIKIVEEATGLPFGDEYAPETISCVSNAETGKAILW